MWFVWLTCFLHLVFYGRSYCDKIYVTVAPEAHSKAINAVMTSATFCSIPIYTAVTLPHPCPRPLATTTPPPTTVQ